MSSTFPAGLSSIISGGSKSPVAPVHISDVGNFYIRCKFLKSNCFRNLAWMYWLQNPLLPFIWFRLALPRLHQEIEVEECRAS